MLYGAAKSVAWLGRTLLVSSWRSRIWLLGLVVVLLAFGGSVFGPVTMQTLGLGLVLVVTIVVLRLLVGGGRR